MTSPQPATLDREKDKPQIVGKIYFLASETHVKIGFAFRGVGKRTKEISAHHYERLTVLTVLKDVTRAVEAALHRKFKAYRVLGKREWFVRSPEIEDFIEMARLGHWRKEFGL